jgi:hypothetical protein
MPANQDSTANQNGNKEFLEFLRSAPSLEDASAGATTELTGLVSRTTDGRFAITTGDGQTFEMEVGAVQRFRPVEGGGFSPIATILVSSEALKNATLRPLKPIIKEIAKDPIKDIIHDGTHTYFSKDIATDPIADKHLPKDIRTDPIQDKHPFKDIRKDPLQDPIDTGWADVAGTGPGDPIATPDPAGRVTNPAFGQFAEMAAAGVTPFVMATPHHAPAHLVAQQAGVPQAVFAGAPQLKQTAYDTIKEVAYAETIKEPVRDTHKELVFDTRKELVWETWQEGVFDPGQVVVQPPFGQPGFM